MRWLLQTQSFRCDQIWCLIYNKRQKTIAVLQQLFAKNILVSFRQLLTSFYDYWISYSQSYFGITNVIYKYEALSSECSHVLVQMSCMHLICTQVAMCASLKIKITLICSAQSMPSTHTYHRNILLVFTNCIVSILCYERQSTGDPILEAQLPRTECGGTTQNFENMFLSWWWWKYFVYFDDDEILLTWFRKSSTTQVKFNSAVGEASLLDPPSQNKCKTFNK